MDEKQKKTRRQQGEGSISQRADGKFVGQLTIGYDPITLKQIRKSIVRKTRPEVVAEMTKLKNQQNEGTIVETDRHTTLAQWLDQWLNDFKKVSIKATTYSNYESCINWLTPELGAYKLQKLDHLAIQKFINNMSEKKLSPRTINDCIHLLNNALNFAVKHRLISTNPCELVERPTNVKKEMKIFSIDQLLKFKDVSKGYYLEPAMQLLMHGMRRGEILGLCIENLHLDEGYLSIRTNLTIGSNGVILEPTTKTTASSRDIPLTKETIELIRTHIGDRKKGLVFITNQNQHIHPRSFQRSFDMLLKRAKLPKIRMHDMRHSTVSLMLTSGCDLKTVSQLVGHANTRVTTDIYLHSTLKNKREAMNILDNLLTN